MKIATASAYQEMFWKQWSIDPDSSAYNLVLTLTLQGKVKTDHLLNILQSLIRRHKVFLSYFSYNHTDLEWHIDTDTAVAIEQIDLSRYHENKHSLTSFLDTIQNTHFDLRTAPLFRLGLAQTQVNEYVLILCFHHIIADGLTEKYIVEYILKHYKNNTPDFGEQQLVTGAPYRKNTQEDVIYWKQLLRKIDHTQYSSYANGSLVGRYHYFSFSEAKTTSLLQAAKRYNTSCFCLMSTIYAIALYQSNHNPQKQYVLCYPANLRPKQHHDAFGCFMNVLPMVIDLNATMSYQDVITQITQQRNETRPHQHFPWNSIASLAQQAFSVDTRSVFDIGIAETYVKKTNVQSDEVMITSMPEKAHQAIYSIHLEYEQVNGQLEMRLQYREDIWSTAFIEDFIERLRSISQAIIDNPDQNITAFSLLSQDWQRKIIFDWNATEVNYGTHSSIPCLLQKQSEKNPDHIALIFGSESVDYKTLEERVERLTHTLLAVPHHTAAFIPLMVERSIDMVIALLAILKAGHAYVPIAPDFPDARLITILEDCKPTIILIQQKFRARWTDLIKNIDQSITLVIVDKIPASKNKVKTDLLRNIEASDEAYMLYTSGSTGRPKGVSITHGALNNILCAMADLLSIQDTDRFLCSTAYTFDIAGLEIYLPLISGGVCVLADDQQSMDPASLIPFIDLHTPSIMQMTPQKWRLLFEAGWKKQYPVKALCGGEILTADLAQLLCAECEVVWNCYGPTETTIWSTAYLVKPPLSMASIPIGKPVANTHVYVLNEEGVPVPPNNTGELYIGGQGLSSGYLHNIALTQQKFSMHLLPGHQNKILLYRTGDLVQWSENGNLIYIGRADYQIKYHGYRIEPGEIESALAQHPAIKQSIVIAAPDQLIAFYTQKNYTKIMTEAVLTKFLQNKLPVYMLPHRFIAMAMLPLTHTGKIDRQALRSMTNAAMTSSRTPETATEKEIAAIWSKQFTRTKIGRDDNFFHLGGHSVVAIQMAAQINKLFHIHCPAQKILEYPRLQNFATWVETRIAQSLSTDDTPLVHINRMEPIPLSQEQQRFWFLDQMTDTDIPHYNIVLAWKLDHLPDIHALSSSIQLMVSRHELLRTIYHSTTQGLYQEILYQYSTPLIIENTHSKDIKIIDILKAELHHRFVFEKEPPFRIRLSTIQVNQFLLIANFHHMIADQKTLQLFMKELSEYYNIYCQHNTPSPQPLLYHYVDFAAWQKNQLNKTFFQNALNFWKEYLLDYQVMILPSDTVLNKSIASGSVCFFKVDKSISEKLSMLKQKNNVTLFNILMATLYVLLNRYTQQKDIIIGTPTTGRDRHELQNMLGCFANTMVMRIKLEEEMPFEQLLEKIKALYSTISSYASVPFDYLMKECNITRAGHIIPLIQVLLAIEHIDDTVELDFTGIQQKALPIPTLSAKCDLCFLFQETKHGLMARIEYRTSLYKKDTIKRMAGHFLNLLKTFVETPNTLIQKPCLLTDTEKKQILVEWNNTDTPFPHNKTIPELFEEQVARTPDGIALVHHDAQMTYHELDVKVEQLATILMSYGVKKADIVPIIVDKSFEFIIAQLSALKIGAIFIPLRPIDAFACIQAISDDTQAAFILTTARYQKKLQNHLQNHKVRLILIDNLSKAAPHNYFPKVKLSSDDFAYGIYTSGSTGKSKLVMVKTKPLVNLIFWKKCTYKISHHDRSTLFSSESFDAMIWELYPCLMAGCAIYIAPKHINLEENKLLYWLRKNKITMSFIPTAIINKILARNEDINLDQSFRLMTTGGDRVLHHSNKRHKFKIVNHYGLSETTVCVTYHLLNRCTISIDHAPSIGKPISNCKCYILDENLNPAPIGISGELYVGGIVSETKYWNADSLNTIRYIPNPFDKGKSKLYRTGDFARWLPDGNIDYIGRQDHQIKIRGSRIDLIQVEQALTQHPDVAQAVVVAQRDAAEKEEARLVGYIVTHTSQLTLTHQDVVSFLKHHLPPYMIPHVLVKLDHFPITSNGKIDRKNLSQRPIIETLLDEEAKNMHPTDAVEEKLIEAFKTLLRLPVVNPDYNLFDIGAHSLMLMNAKSLLEQKYKIHVAITDFFNYPSIRQLAMYIRGNTGTMNTREAKKESTTYQSADQSAIAIIGCTGIFPDSPSLDAFWKHLCDGTEMFTHFDETSLQQAGVDEIVYRNPHYVKTRGILDNIDLFDASFFNLSPHEATITDPQQRLFLEQAWAVLELTGYNPNKYKGKIGIVAGADESHYAEDRLHNQHESNGSYQPEMLQMTIANHSQTFLSTKIAYHLGLTGPSLNVHTACSTALVAVATACQQLLLHTCDIVLAGAVSIKLPLLQGYIYQPEGIVSPDGHCRAFDKKASGTVPSSGLGIVVLKRLEEAIADGDSILAVIKGVGMNNDGHAKIGYTAPSIQGQVECIREALARAHVDASSIQYVETHGTATFLGDPIEIKALTEAYSSNTKKRSCAIGSVKTNMGHADAAAGLAGLLKTVLALQHHQIPPSLHYTESNPHIDFKRSPFYVNTRLKEWKTTHASPRRAGVSAFGIGGTNVHLILEEAPTPSARAASPIRRPHICMLSAKTASALEQQKRLMTQWLERLHTDTENQERVLSDMAYTLQVGRDNFKYRCAVVFNELDSLLKQLTHPTASSQAYRCEKSTRGRIVFMFPGQGVQYAGMGKTLYEHEPIFRATIDRCSELLATEKDIDLKSIIFDFDTNNNSDKLLDKTEYTQVALFCVEYALCTLLQYWGIHPDYLIGHSVGEYVAALISGVFSLEDALHVVALRGQLMQTLEAGAMLTVQASVEKIQPLLSELSECCEIACINAPEHCVVSGTLSAIESLEKRCMTLKMITRRIPTHHAFHSAMVDSIVNEWVEIMSRITLSAPTIPILSNLNGEIIDVQEITTPTYWGQHLRSTVQFSAGIATILSTIDSPIFLECGPGRSLSYCVRQQPHTESAHTIATLFSKEQHVPAIYKALADLWSHGVSIDTDHYYSHEQHHRIPLPTYPFERQRYWVEQTSHPVARPSQDPHSWLYQSTWQQSELLSTLDVDFAPNETHHWIVFANQDTLSRNIIAYLQQNRQKVIAVYSAPVFQEHHVSEYYSEYHIDSQKPSDYQTLMMQKRPLDTPWYVLHLWNITTLSLEEALYNGLYSLIFFAQMSEKQDYRLLVVSQHVQKILASDRVVPTKATILGACVVLPLEYSHIIVNHVDIDATDCNMSDPHMARCLLYETLELDHLPEKKSASIAYRAGYRWLQIATAIDKKFHQKYLLKNKGVYLITGGTGGMGLTFADYLVKKYQASVILVSRSTPLPTRAPTDESSYMVCFADVADEAAMQSVIQAAEQRFGEINGVIHTAGVPGSGLIATKKPEDMRAILRPKLEGSYVLARLFQKKPLDFVLLCSSLTAWTGSMGQIDYCAANIGLDAFTQAGLFNKQTAIKSIHWNAWKQIGMWVKAQQTGGTLQFLEEFDLQENAITPIEGQEIMERILSMPYTHIMISKIPLENCYENVQKIARKLLKTRHASAEGSSTLVTFDSREAQLKSIMQKCLGISEIHLEDDFFDLGGNSLMALQLIADINTAFDVELNLATLYQSRTVSQLLKVIQNARFHISMDTAIVLLNKGKNELPLFLIHPVGGTVFCFLSLVNKMRPETPVYAIQDLGLTSSDYVFHSLEDMATFYIEQIKTIQPIGPYRIAGYSMGGTIAFEMARQLQERYHETISFVGLIDSWAIFTEIFHDQQHFIQAMRRQQKVFKEQYKDYSFTEADQWLTCQWNRMQLLCQYKPLKSDLPCTLFKAKALLPEYVAIDDALNHWQQFTYSTIKQYTVCGNHETILSDSGADQLAGYLNRLGENDADL